MHLCCCCCILEILKKKDKLEKPTIIFCFLKKKKQLDFVSIFFIYNENFFINIIKVLI